MKQNHYEKLIEYILNDETDKAREVFHNIVVSRSRQIYENMMQQDDQADPHADHMARLGDDVAQEQIGEDDKEDIPSDDQAGDFGDEMSGDHDMEIGDDDMEPSDAEFSGDGDMDDEMGGEGAIEDRVMDLEDALDQLKAEFDELMADEQNEPEHNDGVDDPDFGSDEAGEEFGDEEGEEFGDEEGEEAPFGDAEADDEEVAADQPSKSSAELMREYVETVAEINKTGEGQGVAAASKVASVNTKSTLAGKNDMGGSSKNIARGGSNPAPDGKSAPSADKPKDLIGKVQNTAGGSKKLEAAKKPATGQASGVNDTSIVAK